MQSNLDNLTIKLTPCEAYMLHTNLAIVKAEHPEYFPFPSKLNELYHVVNIYSEKTKHGVGHE